MSQQKSLSEQLPIDATTQVLPFIKRLLAVLEPRFGALEDQKATLETAIALVREVALFRINEVLLPSVERIQALTSLGFLVASSSFSTKLELGRKTFIIDAGTQRGLFTPSPFVSIEAAGDNTIFGVGHVVGYDHELGFLDVDVLSVFGGSTDPRVDWVISSSAGVSESTKQSALSAAASAVSAISARDAAMAARDTATTKAAQTTADRTASAASAAAAASSAADAVAAAANVTTPVIYGGDMSITPAQRAQVKKNIGIGAASVTISANASLTAASIGRAIGCDAGCTALTLPLLSAVESGGRIEIFAYAQNVTISVDAAEPLGMYYGLSNNQKSLVIPAQWSLTVISRGNVWLTQLNPPGTLSISPQFAQSFTQSQKRQFKTNMGAGGQASAVTDTTALLAAGMNQTLYLTGGPYTVTLPPGASLVNGDYVRLVNIGVGTFTVARDPSDTSVISYNGTTASNVSLGAGQSVELLYLGDNWIAGYRTVPPERILSPDYAQTFTDTQKAQLAANLGLQTLPVGAIVEYLGTDTPTGLLPLEGGTGYSRASYANLWAWISTKGTLVTEANWSANCGAFSSGDGTSTFRVPDFRGMFLRGLDSGRGVDSSRVAGRQQGSQNLAHDHASTSQTGVGVLGGGGFSGWNSGAGGASFLYTWRTGYEGGGNEARPINVPVRFFVKF